MLKFALDWFATFGVLDWFAFAVCVVFAFIALDLALAAFRLSRASRAAADEDQVPAEAGPR